VAPRSSECSIRQGQEGARRSATTLERWFYSFNRGDPKLNDTPKAIADAENRLLSNHAIAKQLVLNGDVTRDTVNSFLRAFDGKVESMTVDSVDSQDAANQIQHRHWGKGASHEWGSLIPMICANVLLRRSRPVIPARYPRGSC
jgi:hypothetical protein